jgi:glycosyltransferase involved in cell wall biosynthesis
MKLVHITTVPMSLTFLRGQVGFMKRHGFDVHVISSPGPDLTDFAAAERVTATAVAMPRRITPLRDALAIVALVRELRRVRPAVVHAHTPKGGLLGMIAAALAGGGVRVYHMRGLPLMGARGFRRRLLWATEWLACRLAHRVLCVSHTLRAEAIALGVCPADRIRVLLGGSGNGVDADDRFDPATVGTGVRAAIRERFGIPESAPVIGFVGRVVKDKGAVELTAAWRDLRGRYPELHLLVVGPFEPEDPVPAEIERVLRSDPRVHLAGMDWDTPGHYAAMDLVVLPTYREGFPNVPLEAAAMRLPVVATHIPGCVDAVVHGQTGLLVAPRDAHALREAIAAYLDEPALRRQHGEAGRARVLREFRQPAIWAALLGEYRELLAAAGRPQPVAGDDAGSALAAEALR